MERRGIRSSGLNTCGERNNYFLYHKFLQRQRSPGVEIEYLAIEDQFVFGLQHVRFGFFHSRLRFVVIVHIAASGSGPFGFVVESGFGRFE